MTASARKPQPPVTNGTVPPRRVSKSYGQLKAEWDAEINERIARNWACPYGAERFGDDA